MKDFIKFVKKNRTTTVAFICCVIFVIAVFVVKFVFFNSFSNAIYGNRLSGIEEVKITNKKQDKLIKTLESKDEVNKASINIKGRIINFVIVVGDDVNVDAAKGLTNVITSELKEDELKFYDIQMFISKNNEDEKFPIIGYKHQDKDYFSFTKDR